MTHKQAIQDAIDFIEEYADEESWKKTIKTLEDAIKKLNLPEIKKRSNLQIKCEWERMIIRDKGLALRERLKYFIECIRNCKIISNEELMSLIKAEFIEDRLQISLLPDDGIKITSKDDIDIIIKLAWNVEVETN